MFRNGVCFLLLGLVVIATCQAGTNAQGTQCGENQEYTTCGTACPPTCNGQPEICTLQCIIGCQCKSGYVLNSAGSCVLPSDC